MQIETPYLKKGHWTKRQNMLYIMFLNYFQDKFEKRLNRRLWKIFKLMSEFIQTRTPNQCRSHHQKMERTFQSISNIIGIFKMKIPNYQQRYSKIRNLLVNLNDQNSILLENEALNLQNEKQTLQEIRKLKFAGFFDDQQSSQKIQDNQKSKSDIIIRKKSTQLIKNTNGKLCQPQSIQQKQIIEEKIKIHQSNQNQINILLKAQYRGKDKLKRAIQNYEKFKIQQSKKLLQNQGTNKRYKKLIFSESGSNSQNLLIAEANMRLNSPKITQIFQPSIQNQNLNLLNGYYQNQYLNYCQAPSHFNLNRSAFKLLDPQNCYNLNEIQFNSNENFFISQQQYSQTQKNQNIDLQLNINQLMNNIFYFQIFMSNMQNFMNMNQCQQ